MAKRTHGTGAVFERNGIWYAKVYVDGRPVVKSSRSSKRVDADRLLDRLVNQKNNGSIGAVHAAASGLTISKIVDEYIERRKAIASYSDYVYQAKLYLKPILGSIRAKKLTAADILKYRERRSADLVNQGDNANPETERKSKRLTSQGTINREIALLRGAMREQEKIHPGSIGSLPHFQMAKEADPRQGFISEDVLLAELFENLPRHLKSIVVCAFYCGGRAKEWRMVDWDEVDFKNMLISFPKTKNKRPRQVPIIPGLMEESLKAEKRWREEWWPKQKAVFTYNGRRLGNFRKAWMNAAKKIGLPNLLFHDMRRSANVNMRNNGVPQGVRMEIMGHLTPSMDIRYGIIDKADIDLARDRIAKRHGARPKNQDQSGEPGS